MPRLTDQQRREYTAKVHARAAERDGECLSALIKGNQVPTAFRCAEGHFFTARPCNVLRKKKPSWCPHCAGNARLTIDMFHTLAESFGGRCVSETYVNSKTALQFVCADGHEFSMQPYVMTWQGSWCKECQLAGLDDVDAACDERGGRCLTRDYVNNYTPLVIECEAGHRWRSARKHITDGRWCLACYQDWKSGSLNQRI